MKVIVDIKNKTLKMLENERSIFKGEYSADKLELYINKQLENEYPVITGLLSNGRRIGAFTTDDAYEFETIDGVEYTRADFTLSKENGFSLSEGLTQITIWIYRTKDTTIISKEAIGNVVFTVVNTTAFNDGDIIIAGDVEGTVVNLKVEMENLQAKTEQYLPLTGGKPMTGDLKMKGNNIIFDNDNEETIEIGEEDDEYSMSIRMEDSDYYKGRYRASGFSIGNESINATLDISESKFEMSLKDGGQTSMAPDGFNVSKNGNTTFYESGRIARYTDNYSKYDEIKLPNKSGTIATIDDIPTKTSQLTNDSNYATTNQLFSKNYNDLTNKPSIPSSTSQLTNNSGFITRAVNNLTNYYLKSDTYTKDEVQQLLSSISSLKLEVVTNLPTTNISSNTIYLKSLDSTKENNIYEEYIYINSKWETIGTTAVDLTNYALKEDIPTKISELEQDVELGVSEEDVLQIIEDNSSNTSQMDVDTSIIIGTSADYNPNSDTQIPTTKAVQEMINVGGGSGGESVPLAVEITYDELKTLRDNSNLVAGQQYRITDYQCTTTEPNTKSGNHQFDIIVVADSTNTLNENARAIQHDGDTYFAESNLSAWELKYDLDNDTTKYAWADKVNGKGVIYWLKDEFNNEIPYDFKNIQYVIPPQTISYFQWGNTWEVTRNSSIDTTINGVQYYGYTCSATPMAWSSADFLITDSEITSISTMYDTTGTVISMGGQLTITNNEINGNFFTFGQETDIDLSLTCASYNEIKEYISNGVQVLNNIRMLGSIEIANKTLFNTNNKFGLNCHDIILGSGCYDNTFGQDCSNNTFATSCYNNTFEYGCSNNTFGRGCEINTFGRNCSNNTFGLNCSNNIFELNCCNNIFGDSCCNNNFRESCLYNNFGESCSYNIFGGSCSDNTFKFNCGYNNFGNSCFNNTFTQSYCRYIIIENNCSYLEITSEDTDASYINRLQNVHIHQGVKGTKEEPKVITVARNLDYETTISTVEMQPKLTAGEGITIDENNVISAADTVIDLGYMDLNSTELSTVITPGLYKFNFNSSGGSYVCLLQVGTSYSLPAQTIIVYNMQILDSEGLAKDTHRLETYYRTAITSNGSTWNAWEHNVYITKDDISSDYITYTHTGPGYSDAVHLINAFVHNRSNIGTTRLKSAPPLYFKCNGYTSQEWSIISNYFNNSNATIGFTAIRNDIVQGNLTVIKAIDVPINTTITLDTITEDMYKIYTYTPLTENVITEDRVNELIAAYMSANYDNGDEGSY